MDLKSEFKKELEELRRKYDIKIQGIETEFKERKTALDTSLNVVRMNKFLADAFRAKCSHLKPSLTSGTLQGILLFFFGDLNLNVAFIALT